MIVTHFALPRVGVNLSLPLTYGTDNASCMKKAYRDVAIIYFISFIFAGWQ
jgi:hypothetical protein